MKENKSLYIDIDNNDLFLSHLKSCYRILLELLCQSCMLIMRLELKDLKKIGSICKDYGAIFHSDTVQTIGHYPFNMQDLNVDFLAASAHKFHGPKGIGFCYISENIKIKPF